MYRYCYLNPKHFVVRFASYMILTVLAIVGLPPLSCVRRDEPAQATRATPPDIASCTRVEIHYRPSVLRYFSLDTGRKQILSATEIEYLESLDTIVVEDQEKLKVFASQIALGVYEERSEGRPATNRAIHAVCNAMSHRVSSFVITGNTIETDDGHSFRYPADVALDTMVYDLTPEIRPFRLRRGCATRLAGLRSDLFTFAKDKKVFPSPFEWCDAMVAQSKAHRYSEEHSLNLLKCPEAGEGRSNYAMNPDSRPDSPADTVLLFETKAGWNQHGGPELFTFDNHDPKGGLVLLNDGTVRFIRTEEELKQLRWK